MLLTQVDKTIAIFKAVRTSVALGILTKRKHWSEKYPEAQGLFTFQSHTEHMNLRDGGKQPSCCSPRSTKPSPYSRRSTQRHRVSSHLIMRQSHTEHMNLRDGGKQPSCCSPRSTKPSPYSRQCGPLWL